jgi:hypothetical protein
MCQQAAQMIVEDAPMLVAATQRLEARRVRKGFVR